MMARVNAAQTPVSEKNTFLWCITRLRAYKAQFLIFLSDYKRTTGDFVSNSEDDFLEKMRCFLNKF